MKQMTLVALAAVTLAGCDASNSTAPESASMVRPQLAALAGATLDQSQTASDGYAAIGFFGDQAQLFTAGISGTLSQVDLQLGRTGSPGDLVVQIRTVAGGVPSSSILSSATVAEARVTLSDTLDWVSVVLSPSVGVVSGTQYAIVLTAPAVPPCCDGYKWAASFLDPYPGGTMAQLSGRGASWQSLPAIDFAFKTYVTPLGPVSKDQCEKGGWRILGFANQGQCVRFVETGKDSRPGA